MFSCDANEIRFALSFERVYPVPEWLLRLGQDFTVGDPTPSAKFVLLRYSKSDRGKFHWKN